MRDKVKTFETEAPCACVCASRSMLAGLLPLAAILPLVAVLPLVATLGVISIEIEHERRVCPFVLKRTERKSCGFPRECTCFVPQSLLLVATNAACPPFFLSARYAVEAAKAGYFFSVPPIICRQPGFKALVKAVPLENLLLETDSPALVRAGEVKVFAKRHTRSSAHARVYNSLPKFPSTAFHGNLELLYLLANRNDLPPWALSRFLAIETPNSSIFQSSLAAGFLELHGDRKAPRSTRPARLPSVHIVVISPNSFQLQLQQQQQQH